MSPEKKRRLWRARANKEQKELRRRFRELRSTLIPVEFSAEIERGVTTNRVRIPTRMR